MDNEEKFDEALFNRILTEQKIKVNMDLAKIPANRKLSSMGKELVKVCDLPNDTIISNYLSMINRQRHFSSNHRKALNEIFSLASLEYNKRQELKQ
jgi:hypothetical protein